MAERLFRSEAGGRHEARSAGAAPGDAVHPVAVTALAELGIDASDHIPRRLDDEVLGWADVVVSTCDNVCPATPGKVREDWHIRDPMDRPIDEVRAIRDEIHTRVNALVTSLG
jgi:protein-tyrosine-phosphatase